MAYRNGTYVAFHAQGTAFPIKSDIKYFNLLKAWNVRDESEFNFIDSHEKASATRDESKKETLRRTLITRLNNSKNMILIVTENTAKDTDWVPLEIAHAVDQCEIPIIAAYPAFKKISKPNLLSYLWPAALHERIVNQTAHVIHVPFLEKPLTDAVGQFSHDKYPKGGALGYYSSETYTNWGIY